MTRVKRNEKKTAGRATKSARGEQSTTSAVTSKEDLEKLAFLARVNMIELEHQNAELRTAEAELQASRNRFVALFDFAPIPYFGLDAAGLIKESNLRASRMLGVDRNKLVGRALISFIPIEDRGEFTSFLQSLFSSSAKQSCTLRVQTREKKVYDVLLEGVRSEDMQGPDQRCQIALIDLTDTKRLEQTCKSLTEEIKRLNAAKKKSAK